MTVSQNCYSEEMEMQYHVFAQSFGLPLPSNVQQAMQSNEGCHNLTIIKLVLVKQKL